MHTYIYTYIHYQGAEKKIINREFDIAMNS